MSKYVYFTLKCRDAASRWANALIKTPNDSIILPFSDYPGPMVSEILAQRIGSLTICEPDDVNRETIQVSMSFSTSTDKYGIYR